MANGIRILGYRDLDKAYAFIRDQRDEAKIYADDEGADQTEFCIRLADGRWRNPLPTLVDRTRYDGPSTMAEPRSEGDIGENDEFDNDLDVIANAFLGGKPITDEMSEILLEQDRKAQAEPDRGNAIIVSAEPAKISSRTAALGEPVATRFNRSCDSRKSWKSKKVPAQHARHGI